jgi:hypothetical protein
MVMASFQRIGEVALAATAMYLAGDFLMTSSRPAYLEAHSALNWSLLTYGLFAPVAAEIVLVILGVAVNPDWFILVVGLPLFLPVMVYVSLLYRNWPTGIRIDEAAISIGAVRSPRAAHRRPTVNHQTRGLFTCPWSAVESLRIVTDRAELRQMKSSTLYYTLTNRWGNKRGMSHCNTGVLAAPFMRAALVIEVDPFSATTPSIRPARFYSNFMDGRFSRLIQPRLSPTWIVPTRNPEALSNALEARGFSQPS